MLVAAVGCQGSASKSSQAAPIEVRDGKGAVVASVRRGNPCRATFGTTQLEVAGGKLETGSSSWSTEKRQNGTAMLRDGEMVARVLASADDLDVIDPKGIAMARISRMQGHLSIGDAGSRRLRDGSKTAIGIAVGDLMVTGTDDLLTAGLVASPEVPPEVRALAMCE